MNTILIVEDNDKNMKLMRDILQFKGYQTLEAITGHDGIRMARLHQPDLILMDIQLPDITGIEALRLIREDATIAPMPVVAVSASVMADEQQKVAASGFDAFVIKPIDLKSFVGTIERFVGTPPQNKHAS